MVRFGVLLPQDGKTYKEIAETAKAAETLGFNSFWIFDHFMPFTFGKKKDYLESWTTLSSLASETDTIRLGILVSCASYRNPALLAKMASTVDVLTNGRLEFGIGAGWYREEYEAYGFPFPKAGIRVAQLREAVDIIRGMWTTTPFTFEGRYYVVKDAICEPKPIQRPHPLILIGGSKLRMLKLIAEEADIANFGFKIFGLNKILKTIDNLCRDAGRAPSTLVKSYTGVCLIAKGALQVILGTPHLDVFIAGSPTRCADKIDKLVMKGFTYFILHFIGRGRLKAMETFAKEVISVF